MRPVRKSGTKAPPGGHCPVERDHFDCHQTGFATTCHKGKEFLPLSRKLHFWPEAVFRGKQTSSPEALCHYPALEGFRAHRDRDAIKGQGWSAEENVQGLESKTSKVPSIANLVHFQFLAESCQTIVNSSAEWERLYH